MNRFGYKRYALSAFLILLTVASEWFVAATAGPVLPDPGSVSGATKEQQQQLGLQVMAAKLSPFVELESTLLICTPSPACRKLEKLEAIHRFSKTFIMPCTDL